MNSTIYTLADPRTPEDIRYIGMTIRKLRYRLANHIFEKDKNHRTDWIKSLIKQNLKPEIKPLITVLDSKDAPNLEIQTIAQFRKWGYNLVNSTDGGEGGLNPSAETRLKMSLTRIGRKHTEDAKARIAAAHLGNKYFLGMHHTKEVKLKISATLKGRPSPWAGHKASEETRRKMSESHKLRWSSLKNVR